MRRIAWLIAVCAVPAPAFAVDTVDACEEAPPPAEPWTSWMQSGNAAAGAVPSSAPRLALGRPLLAVLRPAVQVQFPATATMERPKSFGGLFTLALKNPARVGVALSESGRVDIVTESIPAAMVEQGDGPECSGIRQIVWFDLPEGRHIVQIYDVSVREIRVMAADARANRPLPPRRDRDY